MLEQTKQETLCKNRGCEFREEPWMEINRICKDNLEGSYEILFFNMVTCDKIPTPFKFVAFDWENLKVLVYREPEIKIFSYEDYNKALKNIKFNEPRFIAEGMRIHDNTNYKRIFLFKDLDKQVLKELRKGDEVIKPGDYLSTCWGYDQTNVEIFVIKKILGKNYMVIQEIAQDRETTGFCSYNVKINDAIRKIDIPVKAYISNDGYMSVCEGGYKRSLSLTELNKTHYSSDGH
jgi:hypothetical protein